MAVLKDLPDEVLLEVISHIYASDDLRSLKRVSRRLNRLVLSSPSLYYSRNFWNINFGHGGADLDDEDGPLRFRSRLYTILLTILSTPKLALYVESVNLVWDYEPSNEKLELTEEEDAKILLGFIFQHTGILNWKKGKGFVRALRKGKQDAYIALLLLLLGNLEQLSITLVREVFWVHWAVENAASSNFFPPSLSSGLRSLQRVEVDWNSDNRWEGDAISLYNIIAFCLLPSIDWIEARKVEHDDSWIDNYFDDNWKGKYGTSSLTGLELVCSSINLGALEAILSIPKKLLHFTYHYTSISSWKEAEEADCEEAKAIMKFKHKMQDFLVGCSIDIQECKG